LGRLRRGFPALGQDTGPSWIDLDWAWLNSTPAETELGIPLGPNLTNLTTGQLTAEQVAALTQAGQGQVQQVYQNAVTNYGASSPAAQAAASILPAQTAGVAADIAALNPNAVSDWTWWAILALGAFVVYELTK